MNLGVLTYTAFDHLIMCVLFQSYMFEYTHYSSVYCTGKHGSVVIPKCIWQKACLTGTHVTKFLPMMLNLLTGCDSKLSNYLQCWVGGCWRSSIFTVYKWEHREAKGKICFGFKYDLLLRSTYSCLTLLKLHEKKDFLALITGLVQGVLHTTGGYMIYTATTFKYAFDYHSDDVYW